MGDLKLRSAGEVIPVPKGTHTGSLPCDEISGEGTDCPPAPIVNSEWVLPDPERIVLRSTPLCEDFKEAPSMVLSLFTLLGESEPSTDFSFVGCDGGP